MENTVNTAPVGQLKTNKGLLKTILLSLITFGIYLLVVMSSVSDDINIVASRHDGKKTMHFCLLTFVYLQYLTKRTPESRIELFLSYFGFVCTVSITLVCIVFWVLLAADIVFIK